MFQNLSPLPKTKLLVKISDWIWNLTNCIYCQRWHCVLSFLIYIHILVIHPFVCFNMSLSCSMATCYMLWVMLQFMFCMMLTIHITHCCLVEMHPPLWKSPISKRLANTKIIVSYWGWMNCHSISIVPVGYKLKLYLKYSRMIYYVSFWPSGSGLSTLTHCQVRHELSYLCRRAGWVCV